MCIHWDPSGLNGGPQLEADKLGGYGRDDQKIDDGRNPYRGAAITTALSVLSTPALG